jgi:uroporphyrinogen III methyltransferase/synthase
MTATSMNDPQVFLVGAGPGHPGLLTLRGAECLALADLVVYDRLVPVELLEHAPPKAERLCVDQLPGCHPDRWPHIHRAVIEAARQGKRVVRLHGGDPFLYGRGAELVEALRQEGIEYEVVPGVTSGLAVPACAGIPVTHRLHASAVAFVTGHEQPGKAESKLDWAVLARFPGTLVIYMGLSRLSIIVEALLAHGKPPDTPAAAIHRGSTPHQRTVEASLADLPAAVQSANLTAPAIIVIGPVVGLRSHLDWFEKRPLFGKRVLVTRPRHQSRDLCKRLEDLGAVALTWPILDIREPSDWSAVDRALAELSTYQWLVFTSANGVHALLRRLRQTGRDLRALGRLRLAVIGPGTADALREYHLEPDLIPAEFRSEALAAALKKQAAGQRVLLARADRGRELLREELAGVADVEQVAVYSQVDGGVDNPEIVEQLRQGHIDYVTVTSSNIARGLARLLDGEARAYLERGAVKLVSISPVTSAALREVQLPVAAEAEEYTTAGVLRALLALAAARDR